MNFCILGAGAWGTAMAVHLSRNGHSVTLIPRRIEAAMELAKERENKAYMPGVALPQSMQIGFELKPALMEADVVFLACPSIGLRLLCESVVRALEGAQRLKCFISLCKGLDASSLKRPTEVVKEVLDGYGYGVLSGPAYAREVAEGKPTALVLSTSMDNYFSAELQKAISSEAMRVYLSSDIKGVEWGSCLKNVYAIGAGINDGLGLGDNSKAAYLTRAIHEMTRLGCALGGDIKSFYGLSGFGDLVATCQGAWSRNRTFGEAVGHGGSIEDIILSGGKTVEGYWATATFYKICQDHQVEVPIIQELYAILYEKKSPAAAVRSLMERDLKEESI